MATEIKTIGVRPGHERRHPRRRAYGDYARI